MQWVLAKLTHTQRPDLFVRVLGWFEDTYTVHIAMEYVQYGDLGRYIVEHRAQAKMQVKQITLQVLKGLVELHERDICHRNLKPQVRHQSGREMKLTVL